MRPRNIENYTLIGFDKIDELVERGYEGIREQLEAWRAVVQRRVPEAVATG